MWSIKPTVYCLFLFSMQTSERIAIIPRPFNRSEGVTVPPCVAVAGVGLPASALPPGTGVGVLSEPTSPEISPGAIAGTGMAMPVAAWLALEYKLNNKQFTIGVHRITTFIKAA
jgi:hypothetical protein